MEKKINRGVIRTGETDIKVHLIDSFPNHPYHVFDDEDMTELAASIEANGLLNPIIVRSKADGRYELISGHRRKRAYEILKINKIRAINALRKKLLQYAKNKKIKDGIIFLTKSGKALNRSNIWREMKELCKQAGVSPKKVFPHNLRHLFARTFYGIEKDIAKLADILGHSNINTTRIYIITTGAEHQRRMENMRLII